MARATLFIYIFSLAVVVMLLFALNVKPFYSTNLNDKAGLEHTSSFMVYTDGISYYGADSMTHTVLFQSWNCTALVASLISTCQESGCITFKAGVYPCNFSVNKKLCISGEGRATTVIHGTITLDATLIHETPRSHHAIIQNLRLDGQKRLEVGIKYESPVPSVPLITVQNIDIENYTEYGILFINASDCLIDNAVIGNCGTAIYYTTNHNFGRITNCELLNYNVQGLYTDAQIYLSGTVFSAMQTLPSVADLVLDNAFGTVTGCWFENNGDTPCIDMPNRCYRPLIITGCFFANKGGDIIRIRNAFSVLMNGNFFSQQLGSEKGCCAHIIQGTLYWGSNQLDPAFAATLSLYLIENEADVKIIPPN